MSPILMLTADTSGTFTATLVIAGIVIVVGMLLLLILIFNLFGKFVPVLERVTNAVNAKMAAWWAGVKANRAAKKAEKNGERIETAEPAPSLSAPQVSVKSAPAPVVEQGISDEVVAAIAAAVAATEGAGAVVRSIKKKNVGGRNPWSAAATADNTRPF